MGSKHKHEEELSDSSNNDPKSNHNYIEEASSPYLSNNALSSDGDSISDVSRKISKKRNAYQKISDDIRVNLLESVQNGETLKAAAKRHKINYSSAKSILHTYRKEGRILKKSAQERTTKKKNKEPEQTSKAPKSSKKESGQSTLSISKVPHSFASLTEKTKAETASNASIEDHHSPLSTMTSMTRLNDNFTNLLKMDNHYDHISDRKDSIDTTLFQLDHQNLPKDEEQHMKVLASMGNGDLSEMNHMIGLQANPLHRGNYYYDASFSEMSTDQMIGDGPDHVSNHMFFPKEFDSFNDMVSALQTRPFNNDNFFYDPGVFLCPRTFNTHPMIEDKTHKLENVMDYDDHGENAGSYTLKGFMDSQNLFREALNKASFISYSGNPAGYIKDSFDLF
jgi:hypothetical protein